MAKGLKICGVSDLETLKYILNHQFPPKFVGFITNYKKSIRFVEYEKLKQLVRIEKNETSFVSVLVNPDDEILEKIKHLNFDFYQLYDVSPFNFNLDAFSLHFKTVAGDVFFNIRHGLFYVVRFLE